MLTKTEKYYNDHLQKYFDRRYGKYGENAEYYVNPAINKWQFKIPELCIEVTLICNDAGRIIEKRRNVNKWLN